MFIHTHSSPGCTHHYKLLGGHPGGIWCLLPAPGCLHVVPAGPAAPGCSWCALLLLPSWCISVCERAERRSRHAFPCRRRERGCNAHAFVPYARVCQHLEGSLGSKGLLPLTSLPHQLPGAARAFDERARGDAGSCVPSSSKFIWLWLKHKAASLACCHDRQCRARGGLSVPADRHDQQPRHLQEHRVRGSHGELEQPPQHRDQPAQQPGPAGGVLGPDCGPVLCTPLSTRTLRPGTWLHPALSCIFPMVHGLILASLRHGVLPPPCRSTPQQASSQPPLRRRTPSSSRCAWAHVLQPDACQLALDLFFSCHTGTGPCSSQPWLCMCPEARQTRKQRYSAIEVEVLATLLPPSSGWWASEHTRVLKLHCPLRPSTTGPGRQQH